MKTSLICTVLNEEKTIGNLLDSVLKQTRKPDEIVMVDGGSKDNTVKVLKAYSKKLPIKIIAAEGANIAQGRNIAIKHAHGPIIVSTDGGTVHDRNWLKSIVRNIEDGYDVSAGLFYPLPKTEFERIVGRLFYPDMDRVPDDWPPSSRSAAYTKKAWQKAGGYPEELYTAEDAVFNHRLKAIGARYKTARDAKSYWRPRPTFKKFLKQYFTYSRGNGESLLYINRYPECRMFYVFWSVVVAGVLSYVYLPILLIPIMLVIPAMAFVKPFKTFGDLRRTSIGFSLMISAFLANIVGGHYGLIRRLFGGVRAKKIESIKVVK